MATLSRLLVRFRVLLFVGTLLLTAGGAYLASTLKLYDDPNRWPPHGDPAVQLNEELQEDFGGANLVTVMISRKDGKSIVHPETLAKVKSITDQLKEVQGVIPYAVRSLSTINSRYLHGTEDKLDASILFDNPNRAPKTPEELERVRFGIENNAALRDVLVSKDWSATIIQADFRTGLQNLREGLELPVTDPISIYQDVREIVAPERDAEHAIAVAGTPILIGWVNSDGLPYIAGAFALVVAGMLVVLFIAFRSEVGVIGPLVVGFVSIVWAFGLQRIVTGDVLTSASALLAPFIIVAVAASHSVLFIKRFLADEMRYGRNKLEGLEHTLYHMTRPLVVVLLTDLGAFVVLSFVPFDNVRMLGQVTAFGLVAIMVVIPTFLVAVLSFVPERRLRRAADIAQQGHDEGTTLIHRTTSALVRPLVFSGRAQATVLVVSVLLVAVSLTAWFPVRTGGDSAVSKFLASKIETGQDNTYAVHNYLTRSWEENRIFQMEQEIKKRFGAIYTMAMVVEGPQRGSVKTPEALRAMDGLARHVEEHPEVAHVVGLPFYIKIMNRFLNFDRDEYFRIPQIERAQMAVNEAIYFLTGGMPGSFDFVVDPKYQKTVLMAYVTNTNPDTVDSVIARARSYIDENWDAEAMGGVEVRLPAGNVGIADAFNRSIRKWMILATALGAALSFLAAALMLRSVVGPLLLLFPLAAGMVVWAFLIHLIGIPFNSNVTVALAIASGVGIDAEVYLLYRFREEYPKHGNFLRALFDAFTLVREPLVFSFGALFAGCLAVSFVPLYVGYVGFSMALILLTTFLLSFFAAPVVWALVRPRFLTRGLEVEDAPAGEEPEGAAVAWSTSGGRAGALGGEGDGPVRAGARSRRAPYTRRGG